MQQHAMTVLERKEIAGTFALIHVVSFPAYPLPALRAYLLLPNSMRHRWR
jgi:hypothetical protein